MNHNPFNLKIGQVVILDKDFNNSSEVVIKSLSPNGMFASISAHDEEDTGDWYWQVMTARLSPIEEPA